MKTTFRRILLLFIVVPSLALATNGKKKWKHTENKTYNKEFSVNADALLKVSNTFGNVDITSWNENKVKIDVLITVGGNDQQKVKEQIQKISVSFSNTASLVEAITKVEKKKWKWKKGNKMSMQINYTIKVPKSNKVDISNDYGNISLDEIDGMARINCDYGKLILGDLNASNNEINIDYCSGSSINSMGGGSINADYSGIKVAKSGPVTLNADYTTSVFEDADNLEFNCDYGSLKVSGAANVSGSGDYLSTKIDNLKGNMDVRTSYGALVVNGFGNGSNINVNSSYTGVSLKYNSGTNFKFDIKTSYGGINLGDDANITNKKKEISSKHYEGYVGSNSGTMVTVKGDYGGVTIKRM